MQDTRGFKLLILQVDSRVGRANMHTPNLWARQLRVMMLFVPLEHRNSNDRKAMGMKSADGGFFVRGDRDGRRMAGSTYMYQAGWPCERIGALWGGTARWKRREARCGLADRLVGKDVCPLPQVNHWVLPTDRERERERVGCNDAFGLVVYGAMSYDFPDQSHLGTNFPPTGTFEAL
jgi:hypothetical protein